MGTLNTATVKSIDLAAFMEKAAIDYILAVRVLHVGSIIMTHAVGREILSAALLIAVSSLRGLYRLTPGRA
jgi:hypothetical protein